MNSIREHLSSGSGNGSAPSILCTMETVEVNESTSVEEDYVDNVDQRWGLLFALSSKFPPLDLRGKNSFIFGRGDECDYSFNLPGVRNTNNFANYSKVHFRLFNSWDGTILCNLGSSNGIAFIEDLSSNGTYINGQKLGKGKKQVLSNNDTISLARPEHKIFVFMEHNSNNQLQYPEEIRNRYTMSKELGRGACGEVVLAFEKGTCQKYAVKVISKKVLSIGGKTQVNTSATVMNEVYVLKALTHPCIIRIEDVIDTQDTLFIILELVEGGELFDRVRNLGQLDERIAKMYFYQMVVAIKYLHEEGITHRDLKPENVLLTSNDAETLIKITDFGLSKFVDANSIMKTFCGTPCYLAPEVIGTAGNGTYTQAVDCWSLGVILYVCLVGYPPFTESDKDTPLMQQILQGQYTFKYEHWKTISPEAIDLIKRFLTVDPKHRLTLAEALQHAWLSDDSEAVGTAERLMRQARKELNDEQNGGTDHSANWLYVRMGRPKLKRQHEKSDDTLDGDEEPSLLDPSEAGTDGRDSNGHIKQRRINSLQGCVHANGDATEAIAEPVSSQSGELFADCAEGEQHYVT